MNDQRIAQPSAIAAFHTLHTDGCFVLPNPWNVGTAVYLHHLGFKALATTSAGFAFSRGTADGAVPRDEMLAHIREIAAATPLPVNADFLGGFSQAAEGVAANTALCVATGVAGLSIEDSTGDSNAPLYEETTAVQRIEAARHAIDASGTAVILTGRCEAFLVGDSNPLRTSLARLVAYGEAGADCLYAPGVSEPDEIAAIVKAVAPKPVNVLVSGFNSWLSISQLGDLGVRRISVGSGLALAAWGGFVRAARGIAANGTFETLAGSTPFKELNQLFGQRD
jgi:methylisocitrate lyase